MVLSPLEPRSCVQMRLHLYSPLCATLVRRTVLPYSRLPKKRRVRAVDKKVAPYVISIHKAASRTPFSAPSSEQRYRILARVRSTGYQMLDYQALVEFKMTEANAEKPQPLPPLRRPDTRALRGTSPNQQSSLSFYHEIFALSSPLPLHRLFYFKKVFPRARNSKARQTKDDQVERVHNRGRRDLGCT
jgi:hypothetical protein